jgi:hypothetical protein
MRGKQSLQIFLFCLSLMIMGVTMLRDHVYSGETNNHAATTAQPAPANDNNPRLSQKRIQHILYGDQSGGGHKFGAGIPCKSEFPSYWTDQDIIDTVKALAANDNAGWEKQNNGYYTAEQNTQDGTRVRVVLDREGDDIITAYPVNTRRNACPR